VTPGGLLDCTSNYGWAPNLPDEGPETSFLRLLTAQDVADRSGDGIADETNVADCLDNLSDNIESVIGNAACTPDGAGFALPCIVCQPGVAVTDAVTGLECDGLSADAGSIRFDVNSCTAPEICAPDPGFVVIDESIFTGVNANQLVRNARPGAESLCIAEPPTLEKSCPDPADPTQVLVTFTNASEGCIVEDELYRTLEECPDDLNDPSVARGTGESLGSTPVSGDGTLNFSLPLDLTTAACNVARLVCDDEVVVLQAEDECPPPPGDGENFKCYTAKFDPRGPRFTRRTATLEDQFRTTDARILRPYELCTPVSKNGDGIENEAAHLMCYKFYDTGPRGRRSVQVTDQFGTEEMIAGSGRVLCVPALKNCDPENGELPCFDQLALLQEELNHFQCYAARTAPDTSPVIDPENPLQVELTDQFETARLTDLSRSVFVCNPTAKTIEDETTEIVDPSSHLKCYDADDAPDQAAFSGRTVSVDDQFGTWQVRVGPVSHLCEDASKEQLESVRRSRRR
jgi:hypothetical protein